MNSKRLQKIKLLLLDVDGVLTSGHIIYSGSGIETKAFNVKDGLGIKLLQSAGIKVGIVTGRTSEALLSRCQDLNIRMIFDGVQAKGDLLDTILSSENISAEQVAFVGDDLPDIPLMQKVGISFAVADAHDAVKKAADIITLKSGGNGAVREICEMILDAKNLLEEMIKNCR